MGLALAARLLLATIFLVAGLAKLVDADGSRRAMQGFSVPTRFAAVAGRLLPAIELGAAMALLIPGSAWWGGVVAGALLGIFVAVIALSLVRGVRPDCHCFGQLHSAPVGPWTLVRNGPLIVAAVVVVVPGPGASQLGPFAWADRLSDPAVVLAGVVAGLGLVVACLGWFLLELFQQNGRILQRLESLEGAYATGDGAPLGVRATHGGNDKGHFAGLPIGTIAPVFDLPAADGGSTSLRTLLDRRLPVVLVFADPQCGPCEALLPEIAALQRQQSDRLTIALVSRGTVAANAATVQEHGVKDVLVQSDREIARAYEAHGTPSGVLIDATGMIQSPVAAGADAITALVARAVGAGVDVPQGDPAVERPSSRATASLRRGLSVGASVPDFEWKDIDGRAVSLRNAHGSTVLLFWNPRCGFCERLLPDLREWELTRRHGRPRLLVISTGSEDEHRQMALQAPIVLEDGFETGRVFGASGTPSAVLIDRSGNVESPVSVGGLGILGLLSAQSRRIAAA